MTKRAQDAQRIAELESACSQAIRLFELWRDGVFQRIGVQWSQEPPAIEAMRAALAQNGGAKCGR